MMSFVMKTLHINMWKPLHADTVNIRGLARRCWEDQEMLFPWICFLSLPGPSFLSPIASEML